MSKFAFKYFYPKIIYEIEGFAHGSPESIKNMT